MDPAVDDAQSPICGLQSVCNQFVCASQPVQVVWVLKHGHIGDAFFDIDAARFLLQELQYQQHQQQQDIRLGLQLGQQQAHTPTSAHHSQQHHQQHQQDCDASHQAPHNGMTITTATANLPSDPAPEQPPSHAAHHRHTSISISSGGGGGGGERGTLGHAAGPKWTDALPRGSVPSNVLLEFNATVSSIDSSLPAHTAASRAHTTNNNADGSGSSSSSSSWEQGPGPAGCMQAADEAGPWNVYVTLSSGKVRRCDTV